MTQCKFPVHNVATLTGIVTTWGGRIHSVTKQWTHTVREQKVSQKKDVRNNLGQTDRHMDKQSDGLTQANFIELGCPS